MATGIQDCSAILSMQRLRWEKPPKTLMRILVISSCTGKKAVAHTRQLTLADFDRGDDHVRARERELSSAVMPAWQIYTGEQHKRLMRGINAARSAGHSVVLKIVSAGYGLIDGNRIVAPYECSFSGMPSRKIKQWATARRIPSDFRRCMSEPYDLTLVLLGESYLKSCEIDSSLRLQSPTTLWCGYSVFQSLPRIANLTLVPIGKHEARIHHCGLVGLKGELAAQMLERLPEQS